MKSLSLASASTQNTYRYFSGRSSRFTNGDRQVSALARPARFRRPGTTPKPTSPAPILHDSTPTAIIDCPPRSCRSYFVIVIRSTSRRHRSRSRPAGGRRQHERGQDRQAEHDVDHCEDPGLGSVEDQLVCPVAEEVARDSRSARPVCRSCCSQTVSGQGIPASASATTIPIAVRWIARNQKLRTQLQPEHDSDQDRQPGRRRRS